MRADGGEANDIAVRANARWNARAELDEDTRCIGVGIGDGQWLIDFKSRTLPSRFDG